MSTLDSNNITSKFTHVHCRGNLEFTSEFTEFTIQESVSPFTILACSFLRPGTLKELCKWNQADQINVPTNYGLDAMLYIINQLLKMQKVFSWYMLFS